MRTDHYIVKPRIVDEDTKNFTSRIQFT